jgi:Sulfotransferase family
MVSMTVLFLPGRQPKRGAPKPLLDPVNKIILFWMHRCGSTTGQLWFFHVAGWEKRMKGKGASQLAPEWYDEHTHAYEHLAEYYRDPSFLKVAVVRNPLERAVSAYTVVTDTKSGSQWRAASRSIAERDDDRRLSFNEFLDFLETEDLATANYHWRLQTAQDCFDLNLPDVQLARVETLQQDLDRLCRRMGKKPVAMRMNSAQTKIEDRLKDVDITSLVRTDFARLFGHDKRGVIRFPHYSRFLNERTIARLAKLYARDFGVLGYKPIAES